VEKDNASFPLLDGNMAVEHAGHDLVEVRQFVIMGREQRAGAQIAPVRNIFDDRPGNRQAVVGAGAAADFVEDQQASGCRLAEDLTDFIHLDHEGRLAGSKVIRGADPGEKLVHDADDRFASRHMTADLGQDDDQGDLAHIGRFTGHVGAREDHESTRVQVHLKIVGHESAGFQHLLDDRVTAIPDLQCAGVVERRAAVIFTVGQFGEAGSHVEPGQGARRLLQGGQSIEHLAPDIAEHFVLQRQQFLFCPEDCVLHVLELIGDIPLAIGQCLLADKMRRNLSQIGPCHVKIKSEDLVVADLETADAALLAFAGLQSHDPVLAVPGGGPELIDLFMKAIPDQVPVFDRQRRIWMNRANEQISQVFLRRDRGGHLADGIRLQG